MSITIGDLKYQNTDVALHRYMRDTFSWLYGMSVVDGIKGRTTMNSIGITGNMLVAADCVLDTTATALASKEVALDYYNLAFPIALCDLKQTWLSGFANKYKDEKEVYIEWLIPYLAEQVGEEVRAKVNTDILAEATADADVTKVTLAGLITTPANAYTTLIEFIDGLPAGFLNDALDKENYSYYSISVSPAVYKLVSTHLSDKTSSYGLRVGGFNVVADKNLTGKVMVAQKAGNGLVIFDSAEDLAKVRVVNYEWLNTSYIMTGLGFKGSYVDSTKIVISN